jgi:hypothetical protein
MAKRRKKTNFQRLLKEHERIEYESTVEDCQFWFDVLNSELFNKELPRVPFRFKRLRKCWAYYEYFPRKPNISEKIIMNERYPSHKLFVECLAHEMVHHWQYMKLGWRKVDHGDEFQDWCNRAKQIGLRMGEEQNE